MKTTWLRPLGVAWLLFLPILVGCGPAPAPSMSAEEKAAVRAMTDRWLAAHASRDWNELALQYTESAILLPPMAEAIEGRAAIRAWFEANENDTNVEITILEVEGYADLAYVRGESEVTLGASTDAPVRLRGKYLDIRRRQPDGSWLVSIDMFSPDSTVP